MLVDSHSHLFLEEFAEDLPLVMERARAAGVTHIFMPNIDSTTIEPMLSVCDTYRDFCFPMIGCKLQKKCEPQAFSATNVFFFFFFCSIILLLSLINPLN